MSLFPTHTPVIANLFPPTVQLSLLSLVVPVLTAIFLPGIFKSELVPKTADLAALSDKMSTIKYACSSLITLFSFCGLFSSKTLPSASSTFNIPIGSTLEPPFKKAEYPAVKSKSLTSPPPKVNDNPTLLKVSWVGGRVVIPIS